MNLPYIPSLIFVTILQTEVPGLRRSCRGQAQTLVPWLAPDRVWGVWVWRLITLQWFLPCSHINFDQVLLVHYQSPRSAKDPLRQLASITCCITYCGSARMLPELFVASFAFKL